MTGIEPESTVRFDQGEPSIREFARCIPIVATTGQGVEIPLLMLAHPTKRRVKGLALWITNQGISGLLDPAGNPHPELARLVDEGLAIVGADLIGQGAKKFPAQETGQRTWVSNPREAAGYMFGYNRPIAALQAADLNCLISHMENLSGIAATTERFLCRWTNQRR